MFLGDSWFGSVKTCVKVAKAGYHGCFMVKIAHSRSPKKFLEDTMKDFSRDTWIRLKGKDQSSEVELVSIGYMNNKKNVLTFVPTKRAGTTLEGELYKAGFPDKLSVFLMWPIHQ